MTTEQLSALIAGLAEYKRLGVVDPWLLSDGTKIEPLDVLRELKERRESDFCPVYGEKVLPNEQGKCSLCGRHDEGSLSAKK